MTFFGAKSLANVRPRSDFWVLLLTSFALLAALIASVSVCLNDVYFWRQSPYYLSPYLFLLAFFLGLPRKPWGLMACIFLLPLSAGLGNQLNAYLGAQFLTLPNAGLDLVAGLFLGLTLGVALQFVLNPRGRKVGWSPEQTKAAVKNLMPWPVALVIVMITISTAIAISRNIYQSAAPTSLKGVLFNLVHFRPIGWHDDFMPISDWIAYALAVATIAIVIGYLKNEANKNAIIFRPIIAGLVVAVCMGIAQAITGIGLPESLLSFRRDAFGFAVIGFQPDLHAYAGHMLLGAVGLWGYFFSGISKLERKFVLLAIALCWTGLILSKSRALLLIAIVAMLVWLVVYLWKKKRRIFLPTIAILAATITIFVVLIFNLSNNLSGIPVLSWLGELANEFKGRDLTSWSLFSGIFGSRFEIWEAAIRMWWEFPLMGIGQGNFYRLSDIASFSKSHFLILNHGENAHNYFLQTLTETGLLGAAVFLIASLASIVRVRNKKILIPACIAILSLFLGNIFSHSFLVRENLLILSVLFGCIYCADFSSRENLSNKISIQIKKNFYKPLFSLLTVIVLLTLYEVVHSFGAYPFVRGFYCYSYQNRSADGWTSGLWRITLPDTLKVIKLRVDLMPAEMSDRSLLAVIRSHDEVVLKRIIKLDDGLNWVIIEEGLDIPINNNISANKYLELRTSNCNVPKNIGFNLDARRLGIRLLDIYVDERQLL